MTLIELKQTFPTSSGRPKLNETLLPTVPAFFDTRTSNVRNLMRWVKATPEAIGIVNRIARDTVTPVTFRAVSKVSAGRPSKTAGLDAEKKAMEFYKKVFFRQVDTDCVIDEVITGDSFIWKGKISQKQVFNLVKEAHAKRGLEVKEIEFKISDYQDEDSQGLTEVQHVPSTTMIIHFDEREVLGYRQLVINAGGTTGSVDWSKDSVVHGTFMRVDGKVYGFTPMTASIPVIKTLGLIKDYTGNFFNGGGAPDLLVSFEENLDADTRSLLEQRFQEYKDNLRRGHMFVDGGGKMNVERINEFDKDMEFYKLAMYYTGVLAHSLNMPSSFMGPIIGSIVKASTGGIDSSEGAYWKNIRAYQEYREDLYNSQIWVPFFGVEMHYKKPYLIDNIKESQNMMFINDALAKTEFMLNKRGKTLKTETILELLGFDDDRIEDMSEEAKAAMQAQSFGGEFGVPGNRQGQPDNKSIDGGSTREGYRGQKKKQATNQS